MTDAPLDVTELTNDELESELEDGLDAGEFGVDQLYVLRSMEEENENRTGAIEAINAAIRDLSNPDEPPETAESVAGGATDGERDADGADETQPTGEGSDGDSGESEASESNAENDAADGDSDGESDPFANVHHVTVTPPDNQFKSFTGSYVAGIFFETDSQTERVPFSARVRQAIDRGALEVVATEVSEPEPEPEGDA